MKTAEDFKRQAQEKKITHWYFRRCSICGEFYGFEFIDGENVEMDTSCGCSWSYPRQSSWQEIADLYNLNIDNPAAIADMDKQWGFSQVTFPLV